MYKSQKRPGLTPPTAHVSERCSHCGYCEHCGRSNQGYVYPYQWNYPYQWPYWYGGVIHYNGVAKPGWNSTTSIPTNTTTTWNTLGSGGFSGGSASISS